MDKDQLINNPEINIVGVIANHRFNWYVCSNDMWTMDIDKYIQSYKEAGWDLDFSYLPEIQQNLHVVTKSNLETYFIVPPSATKSYGKYESPFNSL